MVLRDDSEKRLLDAMAMEKEYRKLQTDWEAKTAFGYHDKLKKFGFNDTIEYERAKDEYYLKTTDWQILTIGASEFLAELRAAYEQGVETIFIVYPEKLLAWIGSDDYNQAYCKDNDIPAYKVGYAGGTIVTGPEDVAIGVLTKNPSVRDTLADIMFEEIRKYFPDAKQQDNDILIDGYKVFGVGRKTLGDGWYLATYQITFRAYPDAIEKICVKQMKKSPKGMGELGQINRADLVKAIKAWLK